MGGPVAELPENRIALGKVEPRGMSRPAKGDNCFCAIKGNKKRKKSCRLLFSFFPFSWASGFGGTLQKRGELVGWHGMGQDGLGWVGSIRRVKDRLVGLGR